MKIEFGNWKLVMEIRNWKLDVKRRQFSIFNFLLLFSILNFLCIGCQKVININLNSVSPQMVITGNVNDQPGPYTVTLTQTVNFSQANTFPPVNGAFITIADNAGDKDTLVQTAPGTYQTTNLTGVAGRTYNLTVVANGQTYTSSSTMPQAVAFDTLQALYMVNPFGGFGHGTDTNRYVEVSFLDPGGTLHYYRFIETRNDTLLSTIHVIDDQNASGDFINYPLRSDTSLAIGDSVKVEMQCIDEGTYQYLSTFNEANGNSQAPANPISNISNNALGYFSAHTSRYKRLKVEY